MTKSVFSCLLMGVVGGTCFCMDKKEEKSPKDIVKSFYSDVDSNEKLLNDEGSLKLVGDDFAENFMGMLDLASKNKERVAELEEALRLVSDELEKTKDLLRVEKETSGNLGQEKTRLLEEIRAAKDELKRGLEKAAEAERKLKEEHLGYTQNAEKTEKDLRLELATYKKQATTLLGILRLCGAKIPEAMLQEIQKKK